MKVTNPSTANVQTQNAKKSGATGVEKDLARASTKASALDGADIASSARVDLSPRAKEIGRVREMAKNAPDVDEAKVAKFQALIDKGLYKVDAEKVADKMVDEHVMNELAARSQDDD